MDCPSSSSSPRLNTSSNTDNNDGSARRYGINVTASSLIQSPLTTLLEYSGLLGGAERDSISQERHHLIAGNDGGGQEDVTITIVGGGGGDGNGDGGSIDVEAVMEESQPVNNVDSDSVDGDDGASGIVIGDSSSSSSSSSSSMYQRYDIPNFARCVEQILPFSLLLLLVFIRQHFQGFCVALWVAAVLYKSNDFLKRQTALKGERKRSILICMAIVFVLHVFSIYWWYSSDDLLFPLCLLPPKTIPPFWHAVFLIMVNDVMVRQAAMVLKCILLVYYKNSKGQKYRKQGQMLTLVEYSFLLYRSLLPTPVWYRFFLNKEYGSFFSSLVTGLYLTFKLTSILGKVRLFFAALRALSRKEMHYGTYATSEQVNTVGDLCAICQEKMHAPILLSCKHIFCEDCVSEWFERERTCPLCRALVKPADIRSYSDGSTNLFFQLF